MKKGTYNKKYYSKNREKILVQSRIYYWKNKERYRIYRKEWYQRNKEKIRLRDKIIYQKNKKELKISPKRKYQTYKFNAKRHNIKWNLSFEQFMSFWQKSCSYCGSKIETIGLDRVDNKKGYSMGNVAPCCKICNYAKRELTIEEFIQHCQKIIRFCKGKNLSYLLQSKTSREIRIN